MQLTFAYIQPTSKALEASILNTFYTPHKTILVRKTSRHIGF